MKYALITALCALPFISPPAFADDITVQGRQTPLSAWVETVSERLDAKLRYPPMLLRAERPTGVVSVNFVCGDDGTPAAVTLSRQSGSSVLDRAAMRAVSRMGSLHPLPVSIAPGQQFRAVIVFANDDADLAHHQESLRQEAAREQASGQSLAIVIASRAAG